MIRIGILSDTHGFLPPRFAEKLRDTDLILHAGDIGSMPVLDEIRKIKPMKAVYGNIDPPDIRKECSEHIFMNVEGISILMIHIGGYPGKYSARARKLIRELKPALFISGHSHILKVMPDRKNNLLHINPGACGRFGFQIKNTMVFLNADQGNFKDLEVFEMDR
ncbi:MAG: metallophosphoesterase family protein [Bacteroidota bacterium]|nr:metallophosphoesterase family protein [Bacteroidota bacterium]